MWEKFERNPTQSLNIFQKLAFIFIQKHNRMIFPKYMGEGSLENKIPLTWSESFPAHQKTRFRVVSVGTDKISSWWFHNDNHEKVCRDSGDWLSITNDKHVPNKYQNVYLMKDKNINYLYTNHHGWRDIYYCISPPPLPTDPRRQGNSRRFTINAPQKLRHRCINSVCHMSGRYREWWNYMYNMFQVYCLVDWVGQIFCMVWCYNII